jgi:hypothetical protein
MLSQTAQSRVSSHILTGLMSCHQCDRLTAEVRLLEREYGSARKCLDLVREEKEPPLVRKLQVRLDNASIDLNIGRLALEKHRNNHGSD